MIDLDLFISKYVIKREKSMFEVDINANKEALSRFFLGKTVLVVGGAGSIGSSFVKALLPFEPGALVVVDTNENALTELTRDMRSTKDTYIPSDFVTYPMDYASDVFERMFRARRGFDIVANFSAHKHVRSEKDIFSIEALLKNNLLYARKLMNLLIDYPPETYFCVSTDKAANPVNIMGASKRIMEDLIFSYSNCFAVKTARFANVAFSNGSLPAGFLSRIQKLQPISAPSDIKRFFVSPEESGQICLLATALGLNREIFFPKLEKAQMMSFDEIGTNLLKECGYQTIECLSEEEAIEKADALKGGSRLYPVFYSHSDTSGEKEFEEFSTQLEEVDEGRYVSLNVIVEKQIPQKDRINQFCDQLEDLFCRNTSKKEIVSVIESYLPEFRHIETGKTLDSKM